MSDQRRPKRNDHPAAWRFVFPPFGRQPTIANEIIERMREKLPTQQRKGRTKRA
jgi:hypothetical protein